MASADASQDLLETVQQSFGDGSQLLVRGGNGKAFYGNPPLSDCPELDMRSHAGVIDYVPEELMIRVRAGTPLSEVVSMVEQEGQMLAFEPPDFDNTATMGGVIAAGLSGPRRPFAGAVRDFVLGITLLTGQGQILSFGGQVMKNVAGYDVSRLMVGALGTLGVILDVSLKVLPKPAPEETFCLPLGDSSDGIDALLRQPVGLSAHACFDGNLYVRVKQGTDLDGEVVDAGIWNEIATHRLPCLGGGEALWRVSVPRTSTCYLDEAALVEWGGALRWVIDPESDPHQVVTSGHATLFRSRNVNQRKRFHPLNPTVARIHENLKKHFDPKGILNPGRMTWFSYAD